MKPVILSFGLLLGTMLVFVWMEGKFGNSFEKLVGSGKFNKVYFETKSVIGLEKSGQVTLKVNNIKPVEGYNLNFVYDSTMIRVEEIKINEIVFDKIIVNSNNQGTGKISVWVKSNKPESKLKSGELELLTMTIVGIKKGESKVVLGDKKMITTYEKGELVQNEFEIEPFAVTVK